MMNELSILDELLNGDCGLFSTMGNGYSPDVDVMQTKSAYEISMELPGKTEKDVDLSLKDNVLTVSSVTPAEVKEEKSENTEKDEEKPVYLLRERRNSSFTRSFKLPRDIDAENVSASFVNGVLTVTVPRKPEEEAKKIAIRVA